MTLLEFFSLLGGVGLFLYGMTLMSAGLRNACGNKLQTILDKATSSKLKAVLVGIGITVLVQSSSATDVMVIGFVNSGLMALSQAIGVIMGANIGTTITAQITAFNLSAYAPLILFIGAILYMFVKKQFVKYVGCIIMGFGMLFQGIAFMKTSIAPLAQTSEFIDFVSSLSNPIITVIFGILFTALLQSSSSATVIFQAFAVQGIISYETCVFLVIGSAVGSVTPNLLASLTTNKDGKRTALLNLIFNTIRAIIMTTLVLVFPPILKGIQALSPDNIGRQIANTHTIFAILAVLIMLPVSELIVKLTQKIIPLDDDEKRILEEKKLIYMTNASDLPPAVALNEAKLEILRMGEIAQTNMRVAIDAFFADDMSFYDEVKEREDIVNYLNKAIIEALVDLRAGDLSQRDMAVLYHLIRSVDDIERISDYAEHVVENLKLMEEEGAKMSPEGRKELKQIAEMAMDCLAICLEIFETSNYSRLDEADMLENDIDKYYEVINQGHINRMMQDVCNPVAGMIFTDMAMDLERCSDHAINIAFTLYEI